MLKEEALALTASIKKNTAEFARLMLKAKRGKVWEPLGFSSFSEWLEDAVGLSRSRAYQLLNIALVEERLMKAVTLPEGFTLSDLSVRAIVKYGEDQFLKDQQVVASDDPSENERTVLAAVAALRGNPSVSTVVSLPGSRDSETRAALNVAEAFRRHAADLPRADELDRRALLVSIKNLRTAIDAATPLLAAYSTVLPSQVEEAV